MLRLPISLLFFALPAWASAATFTVDTTSDAALMACTAAAADCSLRGAILAANAAPGADTIAFDIPANDAGFIAASGHWRISVANELPFVDDDAVIDGYTQPGAAENTLSPTQGGSNARLLIEVQNVGAASTQGIKSTGNNFFSTLVVRGLVINRFNPQIVLSGGAAHRIEGCFIGTTVDGTAASLTSNSPGNGIRLSGQGAVVIGGLNPAARNVIAGVNNAIASFGLPDGLRIEGNLIGTNAAGDARIGNLGDGIAFNGVFNSTIGGAVPAARNLIAGSAFSAIRLNGSGGQQSSFTGTRVVGNFIGTDWTGTLTIGNGLNPNSPSQVQPGILVGGTLATGLVIGGAAAGEANLIAHSGGAGVTIDSVIGVALSRNVFRNNRGPAIDNVQGGAFVGPTPNDVGDADIGGNRLQNFPVALGIGTVTANTLELLYSVDSAPANATYPLTVEFFRGEGGQAAQWLATQSITLAQAQTTRSITLPLSAFADDLVVMTATDAGGNTSEFGRVGIGEVFADGFE
ncbi:MAG: hypothetical protein ACT4NL_00850 [Pseudomarimonas sp.]